MRCNKSFFLFSDFFIQRIWASSQSWRWTTSFDLHKFLKKSTQLIRKKFSYLSNFLKWITSSNKNFRERKLKIVKSKNFQKLQQNMASQCTFFLKLTALMQMHHIFSYLFLINTIKLRPWALSFSPPHFLPFHFLPSCWQILAFK